MLGFLTGFEDDAVPWDDCNAGFWCFEGLRWVPMMFEDDAGFCWEPLKIGRLNFDDYAGLKADLEDYAVI